MDILLAEDYQGFADAATAMLELRGFKVSHVATNGHAAMDQIRARKWDAVITDYDLGFGPNGGEVALAALHEGVPLVILWSSVSRDVSELPDEKMVDAIGFHLMEKPWSGGRDDPMARISALLDGVWRE